MIHIVMPSNEAGRSMAQALKVGFGAQVVETDDAPQLASVDVRARRAVEGLRREHLLSHKYDFIWIMCYINEEHGLTAGLFFASVSSFRQYLVQDLGVEGVAQLSTLSQYYGYLRGRFPDWQFADTADSHERVRRLNVARRFAVLFREAGGS